MSKELFERNVYGGPDGRHHRRYRGASTGYRFRYRFGSFTRKRYYHAIIAGFIISLLGGSKVQIGGPTGAFIVIIYGIIQQYGEAGLIVATLMAGVLLVLLGVFKLGAVIKFIPYPIIVGFTSGIAVTIFTTQIADIFGLSFGDEKVPGDFVGKWMIYFRHFDTINWWNTIVSIVSIIIIAITPKFSKKIPGSLIAIIVVTVAVYLMKLRRDRLHPDNRRPFHH